MTLVEHVEYSLGKYYPIAHAFQIFDYFLEFRVIGNKTIF